MRRDETLNDSTLNGALSKSSLEGGAMTNALQRMRSLSKELKESRLTLSSVANNE